MKRIDFLNTQSNLAMHPFIASGGAQRYRQTKRECAGGCACALGCVLVLLFGIFFAIGPTILSSIIPGFDIYMVIIGILLLISGGIVFNGTVRERQRILQALKGRDEISLDMLSSETGVSYARTKEYLTIFIDAGLLRGRIVDDMYVGRLKAEIIDSKNIRCPHCGTELELPEDI